MKTYAVSFFLLIVAISTAQQNQTHFKSEIDFGNGTVFSTFLDVTIKKSNFTITSPKNADVRMFGGKARLGRLLGKSPKKGIIITINGTKIKDSLFGEAKIPVFGKLKFKGIAKNNFIKGMFIKDDNDIGSVNGLVSNETSNNYQNLYQKIIDTIQKNIYSKKVINTKEWQTFQKEIQNLCNTAHDDIEMFLGFNMLAKKLPFTHLTFIITQAENETEVVISNEEKTVIFEEKNKNTAYLLIKSFSNSKEEIAEIFPKIVANDNYKYLIIDLRSNGGGGLDPAFEFAKYITPKDIEVGYFVTNKLQYIGFNNTLFNSLPILQPKNNIEFTKDLKKSSGLKMVFKKPENPVFKGCIYVLTNGRTGSTCEPIVYTLKNNKIATIVGEKTYGGMLAACPFVISGKYSLMLPIADFYTYDGVRLDRVGVTPDVEVKSDDALIKALELINANEKQ